MTKKSDISRSALIKTVLWNYLVDEQDGAITFVLEPLPHGLEVRLFDGEVCYIIFVIDGTEDNIVALEVEVPEALIHNIGWLLGAAKTVNDVLLVSGQRSLDVLLYQTRRFPVHDADGTHIFVSSVLREHSAYGEYPTRWRRFLAKLRLKLSGGMRYTEMFEEVAE